MFLCLFPCPLVVHVDCADNDNIDVLLQVRGGEDGKSRIFRSTMMHNRKQCVALYLEEEYEQLVLECYWTARSKEKSANNRFTFFCIHCLESHKDKNTTSYHRMFKLCNVYKGTATLKMYPIWDKSEQGEKRRIGLKFGKHHSPQLCTAPPLATRPPPLNLDGEAASTECLDVVSAADTSPPPKPRIQPVRLNHSTKPSKKRNTASPSVDQRPPPPRKYTSTTLDKYEVPAPGCPPPKKSKKSQQVPPARVKSRVSFDERLPRVSSSSQSMSPPLQDPNAEDGFRIVRHTDVVEVSPPQPMSRRDIERNAWAEAVRLYRPTNVILCPPPSVDIHGLYILIAETDAQWAPKELLDDPDACMQYLHAQLEDGTLGQKIGNAFGQWYLYGSTTVCPSPPNSVFRVISM
jgi:hypothetical protein